MFENNYLEEEIEDDEDGNGAGESAANRRKDGGDYVVEEADESEDISDDADGNFATKPDSKLKAKRKDKGKPE